MAQNYRIQPGIIIRPEPPKDNGCAVLAVIAVLILLISSCS